MTTYDERRAKGKILCEKLAFQVWVIAPRGIGHWDRCWGVVDAPGAEFMTLLTAWEIDPSDVTMQRVSDAYDAVMTAWRVAAAEFSAERSQG